MNTPLQLTAVDTKPTECSWGIDLTGYAFSMKISFPTPLTKAAVITDAAGGLFEFRWLAGDLQPGRYTAEIMITYPGGATETTDKFPVEIGARII